MCACEYAVLVEPCVIAGHLQRVLAVTMLGECLQREQYNGYESLLVVGLGDIVRV